MSDIKRDIFKKNRTIGETQQKVVFQQKKPLLNYELNLLQDISDEKFTDLTKLSVGNNYTGDSFKVVPDPLANPLTVVVKKGVFYHEGFPVVLADDVVFDNLIPAMSSGITDILCVEWFISEVGAVDDVSIVDSAIGFETTRQQRVIASVVCLDNGNPVALSSQSITFSSSLRSITLQNGIFPDWLRIPETKFITSSLLNETCASGFLEVESSPSPGVIILKLGTILFDEVLSYTKFYEFDPLHSTAKQKEFVAYRKNFFPIAKINRSVYPNNLVIESDILDERDRVVYNFVKKGCSVNKTSNTSISITEGEVFVGDVNFYIESGVTFSVGVTPGVSLIDESLNFIYVNNSGYVTTSLVEPTDYHLMLAEVKVKGGVIFGIEDPSLLGSTPGFTRLKAIDDARKFIPISWNFKYGDEAGTGETGFTSLILKFRADTSISNRNMVFLSSSNGISPSDSYFTASKKIPSIGMATQAIVTGEVGNVVILGEIENSSWSFTPGAILFAHSGGGVTATPPTNQGTYVQRIGVAVTATRIFINPELVFIKNNPTTGESALILLKPNGDLEVIGYDSKINSDRSSFLAPIATSETGSISQTFNILPGRYFLDDSDNYLFLGTTINMGLSGSTYKTTGIPAGNFNKAFFTLRDDLTVKMYESISDPIKANVLDPEVPNNEMPICVVTFKCLGHMTDGDIYPIDQIDDNRGFITDKRNWLNLGNLDNTTFKPIFRDDTHFLIQKGSSWVNDYYVTLDNNETILATTTLSSIRHVIYLDLSTASGGTALNGSFVTMPFTTSVDRRIYMPLGEYFSASSKITRSTFKAYSSKFWQFRDTPYSEEQTFSLTTPASSFTLTNFSFLISDFLDVTINGVEIYEVEDYVKTPTNNLTLNYSAKKGAKVKIRKV